MAMAVELSLDSARLLQVFEGFPAIYRRAPNGEHYYALQARYAQKEGGDTRDPEQVSHIETLGSAKLGLIITFVAQAAEAERASFRAWFTGGVAITAAVFSAAAALVAAFLRH